MPNDMQTSLGSGCPEYDRRAVNSVIDFDVFEHLVLSFVGCNLSSRRSFGLVWNHAPGFSSLRRRWMVSKYLSRSQVLRGDADVHACVRPIGGWES